MILKYLDVIEKGEEKILRKKRRKITKAMFDSHKVLRKEKKIANKNDFLMFGFNMENKKENQI